MIGEPSAAEGASSPVSGAFKKPFKVDRLIEKVATLWPVGLTNAVAATLAAPTVVRVLRNRGPAQTKFPFVTAVMPRSALLAVTRLGGDAAGIFLASELPGKWNSRNRREKKPWS